MGKIRSVLITGSSTGIGRACALYLEKNGFQVFAGVRKKKDGEALVKAATGNLVPVVIDVTDGKSVADAVKVISKATGGELYGLMNNAGIGYGGAVEILLLKHIRQVIDTNLVGIFTVTKAFIPLLRKSIGRIVNTGSICGLSSLPGHSLYSATKFAVEAVSESLRLELRPFGIQVSVLEPGRIATEIWRKSDEAMPEIFSATNPEILALYKPLYVSYKKGISENKFLEPEAVAGYVYHAFNAAKPKRHYIIGKDAKMLAFIEMLPEAVRDWLLYRSIYKS